MSRHKLILIDGNSLLHRAFYALPTLTTSGGEYTNATYGFTMMLSRLLDEEQPDGVAVAFDLKGATFRHERYADYKGHREKTPDELASQFDQVKEVIRAYRIPIYEVQGYEADDVIGTLATQAAAEEYQVLIITGDKDALQLVSDAIYVRLTRRGITEIEAFDDPRIVEEKLGVGPDRVADLKGLMGDKSDNIPGVPGIGPKTAERLLSTYGYLDDVLDHADEVKGKVGEKLRDHVDDARLSKELATIDRDAPVRFDAGQCQREEPDVPTLKSLFARLEFKRLLEGLAQDYPDTGAKQETNRPESFLTVDVLAEFSSAAQRLEALHESDSLYIDILVDGNRPVAAGVADETSGMVFPAGEVTEDFWELLRNVLESDVKKAFHDVKSQLVAAMSHGIIVQQVEDDTMLASYLINPEQGDHSLADIGLKFMDRHVPGMDELLRGSGRRRRELADISWDELGSWMKKRLELIAAVTPRLRERLQKDGVWDLYREVELPLAGVLAKMERRGIALDTDYLQAMGKRLGDDIEALRSDIFELAGGEFNLNSPKQLGEVLFDKLDMPVLKKTKTGPSTSAEVLEQLAEDHEVAQRILDYRQLTKLKSTYVDALPGLVNAKTGRIHTTFNQAVAATGRLSSTNPNLQNIPVRTSQGKAVRKAFIAGAPERVLLAADYSQIELRVLAHISGDESMIKSFQEGMDIHRRTASEIFDIALEEVTGQQRSDAKAVNFGIVYGISSFGLAKGTGLTRKEAQHYIDGYFQRYPGVKDYMDDTVARARETGYVTTLLDRRRYLPGLQSRRWPQRNFAERTAINTPIQGTAADIIKLAMTAVEGALRDTDYDASMLLQVHDELVFEVGKSDLEDVAKLVKREMESVMDLAVPLRVDLKTGDNWMETEPLTLTGDTDHA